MESFVDKEFTELTIKIVRSNYALRYIPELISLYEKRKGQKDYNIAKFKCETFMETIYFKNEQYEETLAIELIHLKELHFDDQNYANCITNAIRCTDVLNRNDEVVSYALGFLAAEKKEYLSNIYILNWYVTNYPNANDDKEIKIVEKALVATLNQLGLKKDESKSLKEQIINLVTEYKRATNAVRIFDKEYYQASAQDRQRIIDDYLINEPIPYFNNMIKLRYNNN